MGPRRVELLVFDGCPSVDTTIERTRDAIRQSQVSADLRVIRVANDDQASMLRFLGSPTVRIDGVDIEVGAESRHDYGLQCRVYSVAGRLESVPPSDWIIAALRS